MSINVGRRGRSRHSAASATCVGAGKSQYPESFLRCRHWMGVTQVGQSSLLSTATARLITATRALQCMLSMIEQEAA